MLALRPLALALLTLCLFACDPPATECRADEVSCGGVCVSTGTDPAHCGACGVRCGDGQVCAAGACSDGCGAGLTDCDRACVDTRADARNCGGCGVTCPGAASCVSGACVAASCDPGETMCLGACVDLTRDERNCGVCGRTCEPSQTCMESVCEGGVEPPPTSCDPPIALEDTSTPDSVVGDGTAASCTHEALVAAVAGGGRITFDCGGPATIDVTAAIALRTDVETILDGEGRITLDGGRGDGRRNRIFEIRDGDFRTNSVRVRLQRLTLQNAEAPAEDFTPEDTSNPMCAWGYKDGQGGAVFVRNTRLEVVDCELRNNRAAQIGPDTGGGAIFAVGSLGVTVVGSTFVGNDGSNGGAITLLGTDGAFFNSTFEGNAATGRGQNFGGATGCPEFNHAAQGGAGGNAGAVGVDGSPDQTLEYCGVTFRNNTANELGTVTRTPNTGRSSTTFNRCLFEGNHAGDGGGAIWMQDMDFEMYASAIVDNTSDGLGAGIRISQGPHGSTLRIENTTFSGNRANEALGGGLVFSGDGVIRNCTFAENEAAGGEGYFGAALVSHGPESQGLTITNTIFWNNIDDHEWTPMTCSVGNPGTPVALPGSGNVQWPRLRNGTNDQEDNECTVGILFEDAMLGALGDNGGPTPTLLPPAGSAAIGLGADCPETDQRGMPRPTDTCAAGAVEPQ